MADRTPNHHPLIDEYLHGLRRHLASRPDADDVIDELRDHLLAATEHHRAAGADPDTAEQLAIAQVGEADAVATAYLANPEGRPAVPTSLTRAGGIAAGLAAIGIVVATLGWWAGWHEENQNGWGDSAQALWLIGAVGVMWTTACLAFAAYAVVRRHGGLGPAGIVGIALCCLAALVSPMAWAVVVWGGLAAFGWGLLTIAGRRAPVAPRGVLATVTAGFGGLFGLILAVEVGRDAGWSTDAWARAAGPTIAGACAIVALIGAIRLARWLTSEEPIEADLRPAAT